MKNMVVKISKADDWIPYLIQPIFFQIHLGNCRDVRNGKIDILSLLPKLLTSLIVLYKVRETDIFTVVDRKGDAFFKRTHNLVENIFIETISMNKINLSRSMN